MSKPLGPRWQTALDLHHQGKTTVQIAEAIDSTPKQICAWLNKRGLTANLHKPQYTDAQRLEICQYAEQHGNTAAANHFRVCRETVSKWMIARGMTPAKSRKQKQGAAVKPDKFPKLAEVRDASVRMRWRGEQFRLVKDHSLLRYFIVRRGDDLPKYCTPEHKFHDGRHAIHDRELVVSARSLRLHPSYLKRLAGIHICDLRGTFSRMAMLESGLLKADDDYQLVDLILAMVERDRRRDRQGQGNGD